MAGRMTRRFEKHNIVGSEADEARPIAYMHKGFVARKGRDRRRPIQLLGLAILLATLLAVWLLR